MGPVPSNPGMTNTSFRIKVVSPKIRVKIPVSLKGYVVGLEVL
jgi:hypothetical protein